MSENICLFFGLEASESTQLYVLQGVEAAEGPTTFLPLYVYYYFSEMIFVLGFVNIAGPLTRVCALVWVDFRPQSVFLLSYFLWSWVAQGEGSPEADWNCDRWIQGPEC